MKLTTLDDEALIKQHQNGSTEALNILLGRHWEGIKKHALVLVKDEMLAEDICQDTMLKSVEMIQGGTYIEMHYFKALLI